MGFKHSATVILGLAVLAPWAQTNYKSAFDGFFGPGRYAKLAWEVYASGTSKCNSAVQEDCDQYADPTIDTHIWVMDTQDGTPRELTSATDFPAGSGHLAFPSLTLDGKRVCFFNRTSLEVFVVNWDGSGLKKIADGYYSSYTAHIDGKDWIIVAKRAAKTLGPVYRLNLDNPSEKVLLYDQGPVDAADYFSWQSLSLDGRELVGTYPWPGTWMVDLADGSRTALDPPDNLSCWPSVFRYDDSYDVLRTDTDHKFFRLARADGLPYYNQPSAMGLYDGCRWTNDKGLVTINGAAVVRLHDQATVPVAVGGDYNGLLDLRVYGEGVDSAGDATRRGPPRVEPEMEVHSWQDYPQYYVARISGYPVPEITVSGLTGGWTVDSAAGRGWTVWLRPGASAPSGPVRIVAANALGADTLDWRPPGYVPGKVTPGGPAPEGTPRFGPGLEPIGPWRRAAWTLELLDARGRVRARGRWMRGHWDPAPGPMRAGAHAFRLRTEAGDTFRGRLLPPPGP